MIFWRLKTVTICEKKQSTARVHTYTHNLRVSMLPTSLQFAPLILCSIWSRQSPLYSQVLYHNRTHTLWFLKVFFFFLISRLLNSRNLIFSPHIACLELLSVFTYSCSKEDSVLMRWQMGLIMIFFRVQIHMFFSCLEVLGVEGFLKSFCKLCGLKNYHKL